MVGNVLHPIVFSHYIILRGRDIAAIEDMVDNGDSGISEIVESILRWLRDRRLRTGIVHLRKNLLMMEKRLYGTPQYRPQKQIPGHTQESWELSYVAEGSGTCLVGDVSFPFSSG